MNLIVPAIGIDSGLTWEQSVNTNAATVDQHNHTPGSGVAVPSAGLNINSQLPFNNNIATSLQAVQFQAQATFTPTLSLYAKGLDLYYNDGAGNAVQLTTGGGVNATSSGISSGTATASFVSSVLVVNADTNKPANIQAGSLLLGNNITASNYLTLQPPNAMPANYSLTLPPDPSGLSGSAFLLISPLGAMTAGALVDGTTIQFTSSALSVAPGGIGTTQLANGAVTPAKTTGVVSYRQTQTFTSNGTFVVPVNVTVIQGLLYGGGAGGGGGAYNNPPGASAGGGGGSGGGFTDQTINVTPGETLTIVIGGGGGAGAGGVSANGAAGGNGGDTSVSSSVTGGRVLFARGGGAGGGGVISGGIPGVGGTAGAGFLAADIFSTARAAGGAGGGQSTAGAGGSVSLYFFNTSTSGGSTGSGFGGGGGGGAGKGAGGNGGNGATAGGGATPGASAAANTAGGGGGGGGTNTGGLAGGGGGSGIVELIWVSP